jgi:hypothetical protein
MRKQASFSSGLLVKSAHETAQNDSRPFRNDARRSSMALSAIVIPSTVSSLVFSSWPYIAVSNSASGPAAQRQTDQSRGGKESTIRPIRMHRHIDALIGQMGGITAPPR